MTFSSISTQLSESSISSTYFSGFAQTSGFRFQIKFKSDFETRHSNKIVQYVGFFIWCSMLFWHLHLQKSVEKKHCSSHNEVSRNNCMCHFTSLFKWFVLNIAIMQIIFPNSFVAANFRIWILFEMLEYLGQMSSNVLYSEIYLTVK